MQTNFKKFIITHIKEAGKIAKSNFRVKQKHYWKKGKSILTETDLKIDKYFTSKIKKVFPGHNIISEESSQVNNGSEYTWFLDPIDGTINFAQGIPFFCISVGLSKGNKVICGAVYDPIHDELFYAEEGKGAYFNNKRIKTTARDKFADAMIDFEVWKNGKYDLMEVEQKIVPNIYVGTRKECLILSTCYVALGRMDGAIFAGNTPWDVAASSVICEEAGLVVTELDGKKWIPREETKGIVIAKSKLHKELMKYVKKYFNS